MRANFGEFEYDKIVTSEGYGVIHVLVYCPSLSRRFRMDSSGCVEYIRQNWAFLHGGTFEVKLMECYGGPKQIARYLVRSYLSGAHHVGAYMNYSRNWIFRGWIRVFKSFIHEYGFRLGLSRWDSLLRHFDFMSRAYFYTHVFRQCVLSPVVISALGAVSDGVLARPDRMFNFGRINLVSHDWDSLREANPLMSDWLLRGYCESIGVLIPSGF
jgi:hypothetical protein